MKKLLFFLEKYFIYIYFGFPLLTTLLGHGILAYDWAPNQSFNPRIHEVINSHEIEIDNGVTFPRTEIVYDEWKSKLTGEIYSSDDFESGHFKSKLSVVIRVFLYGIIYCLFNAYQKLKKEKEYCSEWERAVKPRFFLDKFKENMIYNFIISVILFFYMN